MIRLRPNHIYAIVSLVSLLMLNACSGDGGPTTAQPNAPQTKQVPVQTSTPAQESASLPVAADPVLGGAPDPAPPPLAEPLAKPLAAPKPIIEVPAQSSLMGASPNELTALFGTPSFVRDDPPAQLWQYKSTDCILDLYLYENNRSVYRLDHMEVRTTNFKYAAFEDCARLILKEPT